MRAPTSFIVVGGGASGVILAAHLLKSSNPALRVTLIERRDEFGKGLAYSTLLPDHLLNVSALGMSAFADDPEHFWRWLQKRGWSTQAAAHAYAPRAVYGRYLNELLDSLAERERDSGRLRLLSAECTALIPTSAGVEARLSNGTSIIGHVAILAAGHDEEPAPDQDFAVRLGSAADTPIEPDSRVLILGSGLSMVDSWLTLLHRGHRGQVLAVSRRGLLPSPHRRTSPLVLDSADIPLGTETSYFMRWFRDLVRETEKSGGSWRDVVDGIRPFSQGIWQSWPVTAKRRFLKHTKAWWDVHRHRMAPDIYERISGALRTEQLKLLAGRILDVSPSIDGRQDVRIQLRQSQDVELLEVARIYDCTGIVKDVSMGSITVVRSLTDRGIARTDQLRLGLDVTIDCALIDADGSVSDKLFAVGPLTRGTFFEIDAIPEIRVQCARLAGALTSRS